MQFGNFPSFTSLSSFLFAKEFRNSANPQEKQDTSFIEKCAGRVLKPIQMPVDGLLKNYHKPLMIAAGTVSFVAGWTLYCYPEEVEAAVQLVIPQFHVGWVKLGYYTASQIVITALTLRSFARLNDDTLVQKWVNHEIHACHLGDRR